MRTAVTQLCLPDLTAGSHPHAGCSDAGQRGGGAAPQIASNDRSAPQLRLQLGVTPPGPCAEQPAGNQVLLGWPNRLLGTAEVTGELMVFREAQASSL